MKKQYGTPEFAIISMASEDVILASVVDFGGGEKGVSDEIFM